MTLTTFYCLSKGADDEPEPYQVDTDEVTWVNDVAEVECPICGRTKVVGKPKAAGFG